jgi:hypothetical protein
VVSGPGFGSDVAPALPTPTLTEFVPAALDATGETRARAIFGEIRRARALASVEARRTVRVNGRSPSPLSPTSRTQDARSVALASALADTWLRQVAGAYGMTMGDLKALYLRGDAAGWGSP